MIRQLGIKLCMSRAIKLHPLHPAIGKALIGVEEPDYQNMSAIACLGAVATLTDIL